MKKSVLPLVVLGGIVAYLVSKKPGTPHQAENAVVFSQATTDPLVSGNYANEADILRIIASTQTAGDALKALQTAGIIKSPSPAPLSSDSLSNPEQNYNYGKEFTGPYDLERLGLNEVVNQPAPQPITVSASAYDEMVNFISNARYKATHSTGARSTYWQAIVDREQSQLNMWIRGA